jgi:ribosomal protein L11 methylase PrmA
VPRRVGRRFVIVPTWESFASEPGDLVITLDPGQAFGTGDHPTTRMCLALIEDVPIAGASVLDVGCGSGILSVGACLLGAGSVLAVDIEPLAVEVARENAALNGVEFEARVSDGVPGSSFVFRHSSFEGAFSAVEGGASEADPHLPPPNSRGRDGEGSEFAASEEVGGAGNGLDFDSWEAGASKDLGGSSEADPHLPPPNSRGRIGEGFEDVVELETRNSELGAGGSAAEHFDIVLSNIISAALIRIAPDVRAVTDEGSYWIVSGILEGNWPDVLEAAEKQGFALVEKREEDGWVAATFRR